MYHQPSSIPRFFLALAAAAVFSAAGGTAVAQGPLSVWDTGAASDGRLTPEAVAKKAGWKAVAAADKDVVFQGDAAISNGRLLAVARQNGTGIDLYSLNLGQPIFRTRLLLTPAAATERITLSDNSRSAVGLDLACKAGGVRFRLLKGELFVEAQALSGKAPLRVECPSRFAVLPDFFADDILVDAHKIGIDRAELPSENFLLHFTGKQDAIVMSVFENRDQDVAVTLSGRGAKRYITGSEIDFGKKGNKIWVAVLEGKGMWYETEVGPAEVDRMIQLNWNMPFIAQWRVNFTRQDGLTDSWDMLLPEKNSDGYIKPSWLTLDGKLSAEAKTKTGEIDGDAYRQGWIVSNRINADRDRWTTVLGWITYPCWSDRSGKGFIQPIKHEKLTFDGPVLLYPITRLAETPINRYTPIDIMRGTLGIGPCQHLLDVEGQKQEHVGRATCHVWRLLGGIYGSGQQKLKRKEIETYTSDAHEFITHIYKRITLYAEFGKETRKYLAEQRAAHPELKEPLAALDAIVRQIDERLEPRMRKIQEEPVLKKLVAKLTERKEEPTPPNLAAQLNKDYLASAMMTYVGADWEKRLDDVYCNPLTTIGGEQDEMVGECRWVVKALRQKAGILLASDPRMAPIATEIRNRTQKMLRSGAAYEGARHE